MEEIAFFLEETKESMAKSLEHLVTGLNKIRAGKASPSMLDSVMVESYGSMMPINQVASINTPDARSLAVKPWDKTTLQPIETAIRNSNLGFNPQNDGETIRINIPPLTEERRKELVKQAKSEGENAKISIRNSRKETNDSLKKLQKDGTSEDAIKDAEAEVQKLTDTHVARVDEIVSKKESEIMTI